MEVLLTGLAPDQMAHCGKCVILTLQFLLAAAVVATPWLAQLKLMSVLAHCHL
jgi:hypothetical protein